MSHKFYSYCQNNPGGKFRYSMPYYLLVQAPSPRVADAIAEEHGVYFDGCSDGRDCSCCGDRWSRASEYSSTDVPAYYDTPLVDDDAIDNPRAPVKTVYADGAVKYHLLNDKWSSGADWHARMGDKT